MAYNGEQISTKAKKSAVVYKAAKKSLSRLRRREGKRIDENMASRQLNRYGGWTS